MIKAPFNFVPLSENVYFPDWADQISHDIPFEDGVSGIIEYSVTSKSPIFVRNGHKKSDRESANEEYKSFSKTPSGKYYIPASTLKGVIRNVFEIITASKVGIIKNSSFGIRELSGSDSDYYRNKIKPEQVHCGWLYMQGNNYYLDDCGLPWRISVEEIDSKLGLGLDEFVKNGDFKNDENRTSKAKYDIAGNCSLHGLFEPDLELRKALKVGSRQFVKYSDEGEGGTIVFTGQPGQRKRSKRTNKKGMQKWEGKYFEFVFPDELVREHIEIPDYQYNEFDSIHKNSPDYKDFWKEKLRACERIPVFFTVDNEKNVEAIGLSYMFKYPAFNSILGGLRKDDLKTDAMDMTECVFGKTNGSNSLKGRVMFGNAMCTGFPTPLGERQLTLSTPHPSYYPLYLGNGQTWNSENVRIAGHKRYPVRNKISASTEGTTDMTSIINPLPADTQFIGYIHFHNLRPIELGALIAALTFYKDTTCYHSIGSGKPYGYGKCAIALKSFQPFSNNEAECVSDDDYINIFREEMAHVYDENHLKELIAMSRGIPEGKESAFTYMKMSTKRDDNEFLAAKKEYVNGIQLGTFTEILSGNVPLSQFIGNASENLKRQNLEQAQKEEAEKKRLYESRIQEVEGLISDGNYEDAKDKLLKLAGDVINRSEIDCLLEKIDTCLAKKNAELLELEAPLCEDAKDLFARCKYKEAKEKFIQAKQLGFNSYYEEIQKCDSMIGVTESSITDLIKFTSIPACANGLKKRMSANPLSEDDCIALHKKFAETFEGMKKNDKKKWGDIKNLKPIISTIGEAYTRLIFTME